MERKIDRLTTEEEEEEDRKGLKEQLSMQLRRNCYEIRNKKEGRLKVREKEKKGMKRKEGGMS